MKKIVILRRNKSMYYIQEIFDNIESIKFHPISYREYIGLYDKYVIKVNPFAIAIYDLDNSKIEIYEDSKSTSYFGDCSLKLIDFHHNDYNDGKCTEDPCDIYEKVSGDKIHNGGSDDHKMNLDNEYYLKNKSDLIAEIRVYQRTKKIDDICHN